MAKQDLEFLKDWNNKHTHDTNYKDVSDTSAVYAMVVLDLDTKEREVVYIGSTTNLRLRYKSHKTFMHLVETLPYPKIPQLWFKEMDSGFYDLEIELIKKLKPIHNKQHK